MAHMGPLLYKGYDGANSWAITDTNYIDVKGGRQNEHCYNVSLFTQSIVATLFRLYVIRHQSPLQYNIMVVNTDVTICTNILGISLMMLIILLSVNRASFRGW